MFWVFTIEPFYTSNYARALKDPAFVALLLANLVLDKHLSDRLHPYRRGGQHIKAGI
jgi:hypothetical protein